MSHVLCRPVKSQKWKVTSLRVLTEQQELPSGILTLNSKEKTTNQGKLAAQQSIYTLGGLGWH